MWLTHKTDRAHRAVWTQRSCVGFIELICRTARDDLCAFSSIHS